jgi:hypothetical protein
MSIPVSINGARHAAAGSAAAAGETPAADKVKPKDAAPEMTPANKAKLQLNASILQASASVAIGAQNEPLALLYKSAITSINEKLQAEFGDNAIENAVAQDNTPEGTAERIVSLSTGFFEMFKKQHPGEDEDALLTQFMDTIRGGFETGFNEAKDILKGLNVLGGDIASNIDKTYELVQKGYADFQAAHTRKPEEDAGTA